jgi:putative oxidoreductase
MNKELKLQVSLLALRVTVALVMVMWTIDKLLRPDHAASVFQNFYLIGGMSHAIIYLVGVLELMLIIAFLVGFFRRFTYGAIFILHGISTLSSYKQYLSPFEGPHLLFFAAWPMLAACLALYLLRDDDKLLSKK